MTCLLFVQQVFNVVSTNGKMFTLNQEWEKSEKKRLDFYFKVYYNIYIEIGNKLKIKSKR